LRRTESMGKVKKSKKNAGLKSQPLGKQIEDGKITKPTGRVKKGRPRQEETDFVDDKLTSKIISQAREQQLELEDEFGTGPSTGGKPSKKGLPSISAPRLGNDESASEEEESDLDEDDIDKYDCETVEIDEDDARAMEQFKPENPAARRTLYDIIMEKVTEKRTELASQMSDTSHINVTKLDQRVVTMYRGVRDVLACYRSGKLPKAFKIIPSLSNWEQILSITEPERWTAAAMFQATRIFASNLKERMAQRFFNLVLLPRIRDDIMEFKRLNFHLYQALRKALFKPGAFFKGILIPLCEAGDCTLREAIIIGSVLTKNSVPIMHSCSALLIIAEMEYSGANSIFIRILLDKKYALPYRVIDAIVYHFLKFEYDRREMTVLWHQALLVFVQRYKENISSEQKESLLKLLKVHIHPGVTPEIRRELQSSKCRDEVCVEPDKMDTN